MLKEPIIELEESIEVLKKGKSVKIDEFVLVMSRKEYDLAQLDRLKVNGYLFHKSKNDIPKETIKDELESVKNNFHNLLNKSSHFKDFAMTVGIDYYLLLDYQTGGALICSEINGEFKCFI